MFGGETVLVDCFDMRFGAVADVFIKTVFGKFGGEFNHVVVTGDFGDDGSGRDGFNFGVAFDAG